MSKYEWEQTIFTPEDFSGPGQYIVREGINKVNGPDITNTGYLTTVMKKIGYSHGTRRTDAKGNIYCIIDVSDGLVKEGYFTNTENENGERIDVEKWIYSEFSGETGFEAKTRLCEYLNNNPHKETFRFATTEEIVRVALYQGNRKQ